MAISDSYVATSVSTGEEQAMYEVHVGSQPQSQYDLHGVRERR